MDIQFQKIGKVSGELTINMAKADYEANVNKSLKELGKKVQMPGFRPGHVPASLVKKMYGTQVKADEVNKLLQDSLFDYIKSKKIDMLGEPLGSEKQTPQDIEKQDDFTFIFDIAIAPKFKAELNNEDNIDYYDIEVSDDIISKQLGALQQQAGHPEDVDSYEPKDIMRGTLAELDENGQPVGHIEFCQDNESMSSYGVMRGLHFQRPPFTQSKLVRCVKGAVLDVAVDIRKGSPTYGQHVAVELTEDNHRQFFIPKGFAHGFAVLSETAVFQYKCDNFYHPEADGGISILDESLGIDWQIPTDKAILSEKDTKHPMLKDFDSPF